MIRIGMSPVSTHGSKGTPEVPPTDPPVPSSDDPFNTSDQGAPQGGGKYDIEKTNQQVSGYMGPEMGPFECEHCIHWEDPNSCNIVSGDIDPHGCCNLYQKSDAPGTMESDEGPPRTDEGEPETPRADEPVGQTAGPRT